MKVAYIFTPPWDTTLPPYTLALFAGSTKKSGYEFFGFDLNLDLLNAVSEEDKWLWSGVNAAKWKTEGKRIIDDYSDFLKDYLSAMVDLNVSLYAIYVSRVSSDFSIWLSEYIKEISPEANIILGGPQCFPAYDGSKFIENNSVDAVCTGEADLIWPKVLDVFSKNGNFNIDIPGLVYKTTDGAVCGGGVPDLVKNLDDLPFADYSSVDLSKYSSSNLAIMASRGCINTCAFCSEKPNFFKYRYRSAKNILEEITCHLKEVDAQEEAGRRFMRTKDYLGRIMRLLLRRKVFGSGKTYSYLKSIATKLISKRNNTYISFNDSLINGIPRELETFCDLIISGDKKFRWGGMALLRKEMTKELLSKMHKAGCHNLSWGLETGSQDVMKLMQKRLYTTELAKEIIVNTYDSGIKQSCSLIVGFPGETEEMFQETMKFAEEYSGYFESIGAQEMMILHNSTVYDHPEDFNIDGENVDKPLKWQTVDGMLTYDIRKKRLEKLGVLLSKKAILTKHD